jgi:rhomboid family GlyGly-CTERM serine protease
MNGGGQPARRAALFSTVLSLLVLGVAAWPGLTTLLELRDGATHEPWRVLTGHLVHWDLEHLAWDLGAFAILAALLETRGHGPLLACTGLAALAISAASLVALPAGFHYRGLSGIDSALFALLLVQLLREACARQETARAMLLAALGLAFSAKVAYEVMTGQALFANSPAFTPVPLAHVVGAAVGAAVALVTPVASRRLAPAKRVHGLRLVREASVRHERSFDRAS